MTYDQAYKSRTLDIKTNIAGYFDELFTSVKSCQIYVVVFTIT